jgi:hypothetical protein
MSNNIAIVGTRGAGKTVFTTVLANFLSTPKDGVLLIPKSYDIAEYVELNYAKLQRGEWLDSTNVERKLSWKLRVRGKADQEMTLLDCPGEDIQRLFAKREFENEQTSGSKRDRDLVEYLLGASKVLLLINLEDFIDESYEEEDVRRRRLREHSLKEFLSAIRERESQGQPVPPSERSKDDFQLLDDHVSPVPTDAVQPPRHIAVLFTAYNQYREHIESRYGSVPAFLASRLPALYYEHFEGQGVTGIVVSAVAETAEGGRPKPGFKPQGLRTVIEWLIDPVRYLDAREKSKKRPQSQVEQEQKKSANEPKMHDW